MGGRDGRGHRARTHSRNPPGRPRSDQRCALTPPGSAQNGQTMVLAACGSIIDLGPTSDLAYAIDRLTDRETVLGEFSANATVAAYLLNGSDPSFT